MLITRIAAATVFTPALLAAVVVGGTVLRLCCAVLCILMLWEALRLLVPKEAHPYVRAAAWLSGSGAIAMNLGAAAVPPALQASVMSVPLLVAAMLAPGAMATQVQAAAAAQLAVAYATGLMPLLWHLRERPNLGLGLALMALFCTFASDTGAYFCGRAFGRRKLYVRISPGKTLEGAAGGMACAALMAWAIWRYLELDLTLPQALTLGLIAATFGVLGDLCESLLKRQAGVKDSSHMIPGHGGLLDRFDGVLFALSGTYAYTTWVLGL